MLGKVEAILKSANLNADGDHMTAYCQFHVSPFMRDLAKEISPAMADAIFRLTTIPGRGNTSEMVYVPRLEMVGSNWDADLPVQKMEFRSHADVPSGGTFANVEVCSMHVMRSNKKQEFKLVMGIYFPVHDWATAGKYFERMKEQGPVVMNFEPMGQKNLPLHVEVDREETVAEFANARNSKKAKRQPLMRIQKTGSR